MDLGLYKLFCVYFLINRVSSENGCLKLDISITQKVENEGFHRNLLWLVEMQQPKYDDWIATKCNLSLLLKGNAGYFVNPDEIADISRISNLQVKIDGHVNIETPAHESEGNTVYIFLPSQNVEKMSLNLPIHLRYQRAQITGGFGKVHLVKPSLLASCPNDRFNICGKNKKVQAPCDSHSNETCSWKNVTYQALFEELDLFVPIGDLDDYPLVSIFTLLLGCAGCIYVLSILSSTAL